MILQDRIEANVTIWQERMNRLIREHGDFVIANVTVGQICSGIRGVPIQISDISYVDPQQGIRYRTYTIDELLSLLPIEQGHIYPNTGAVYYLLMGNEIPTLAKSREVEAEWRKRSAIPQYVYDIINAFPESASPMSMFSAALVSMSSESKFYKAYQNGMGKDDYWPVMLDDSLDLVARAPRIAAYIYRRKYHKNEQIAPDDNLDLAANFAHMMGNDDPLYAEMMRLFLLLHMDHENANVSAHTAHLVGSALSDIYLSCSAGLNGLAGPLHGLANQECCNWLLNLYKTYNGVPSQDQIREFVNKTLSEGRVIPGYGHAVLRCVDPRFTAQMEFAQTNFPDDELFRTAMNVYAVVPEILRGTGKVSNPYPNVDAITGTIQQHFGIKETEFYTVLFGVSRLMGFTAHVVWARALGKPIERPKALTTRLLESMIARHRTRID